MKDVKLNKYEGILEDYYETGMECMGLIFHDDRGNHEGPKWDNPEETMTYRSIGWSIWFDKHCKHNIRIFDKENNVVYEGPLTRDRKKIKEYKYNYSFLPKEIEVADWIEYCVKEYRAELWTNEVPYDLKEKFGSLMPFTVGDRVKDDLTGGTKSFVVHMNYTLRDDGSPGTVGYWIDSDYLEGGRHPWELSPVTWEDIQKEIKDIEKEIEQEDD